MSKAENLATIRATTIPYEIRDGGETVRVKCKGYPDVVFYPGQDRWVRDGRVSTGDAEAFVLWLKRMHW